LKLTAEDFRRHYESLPDDALLSLNRDDLVEVARACYDEELAHRRLVRASAPTAAAESDDARVEEPVAAATFDYIEDGRRARALLRTAGIQSYIENEHTIGLRPPWSSELRAPRLMVPASQLDTASELLGEAIRDQPVSAKREPWDGKLEHRFVQTNGIRMHFVEAGAGPLVILCHGFPECWSSWRHQLPSLAAEGYHVIAPDLRGYGQTDQPRDLAAYDILQLTGDIVGLVNALGEAPAVIIGHDWGALIAPYAAMLRPDLFRAVGLMSVPFIPRRAVNQTDWEQQKYPGKVFYQAMLRSPAADQFFGSDVRRTLLASLWGLSGDVKPENKWKPVRDDAGWRARGEVPVEPPPWLTNEDVNFLVSEYERTGFTGGLNYYRNMDRNWALTPFLQGAKLLQRTLFIAGTKDPVLEFLEEEFHALEENVPNLWKKVSIPKAGHWIQQERPAEVNGLVIDFLRDIEAGERAAS
jgi:pimeloyl-ACP methyl ester carboxylesterase